MTRKQLQEKVGIIGKSKAISDLLDIVLQVANSDVTVLIQGESGVGKEVFAKAIHFASSRNTEKLVNVNCGAIPEGILESELFGHIKGSYTGAINDRKGYFEIADNGTLFLDEIAEMPLTTQVKLLRVLETKEFMRIGSEKVTQVNVRIIAAANKDLKSEVDSKRFRSDLYFRLKAVTLQIPPLRERKEDIIPLAEFFLEQNNRKNLGREIFLSKSGEEALLNYHYPGNIRELRNIIESAVALNTTGILTDSDFIPHFQKDLHRDSNPNLPIYMNRTSEDLDREMVYRALIEIKRDLEELKFLAKAQMGTNNFHQIEPKSKTNTEIVPIDEMEKQAILNALEKTKWNKRKAAKLLKINERTFYRKLSDYDL